ncbi:hypothetical protein KC340_g14712 [Hortaea werneckii]|nr:hypothetical protein KC342_g14044 [Hortaea werneckii]KAI7064963.1 hypothetical protein KC339_g15908 [Hortaea werneckii]KAI7211691.1 hypothetical protein KC365_g14875 [Hortaea werneckii]KAI7297808.1 hypothetical protein KC340_g14712 [Hortaea werneckii]KAI7384982.1 hypothetical protein KC328_g10532 [Hortaea werneckii]
MPTGLEEASAILTFVQVGFTLAEIFTTLISEYREAPDELATLANAIVDTLAHIETIKKLLEDNETTHGWNANGIDLATSCLEEAERLVKRIKMLLILTLYKAFTVDSQEQQRLARDRVIVLVRGRQVQRARRKYLSQHSNMPSNVQRSIRDGQEDNSVDPASSLETSREDGNESAPEITAIASPELPVRLDVSDEPAKSIAKETQEASDSPGESTKAVNSPIVSPANRPVDDESTPTAVESQSDPSVDQKQICPPKSSEASVENLVVTVCAMDDAVLLRFGEAFNPPLTADQVRELLQKAPSTTKEVANDADFENEDPNTLHQHNLSTSREDLPQVDTDVGQDIDGAPRAESVATQSSCKTVKVTKMRHLRILFGKLILRKKPAVPGRHVMEASMASNAGAELIELLKLWHIGKWTLTRRTGVQTFSPAPTKFISLLVTLSVEGCTIVPAHLSRDELDGRLWHAGLFDYGPEASLTSQIYASLPTSAHRVIERLLGELDSHGHEILYAEIMGVAKPRAERMIRRKPSNPGTSLVGNRVLLVLQKRQEPKLNPGLDDEYQRENQPGPDRVHENSDQLGPDGPLRVHRVNDGANHTDPVQEMMRAEEMKKMKREREIEEEEKMKKEKEREEKEKMKIEEEKDLEKKRREDEIDNDEEEEIFGNVLGLGDDELVQRLLETYTNMRPS